MSTALALILSAALHGTPSVTKGYYPLADKVDDATFICVGRITKIFEVSSPVPVSDALERGRVKLPVARVAVERVLKGDKSISQVHHEIWRTWPCDTTSVWVGERALFLLGSRDLSPLPSAAREAIYREIGTREVFRNLGSGDGILPISIAYGKEVVQCFEAPVALDSETSPKTKDYQRLLAYVEECCAFPLDAVSVHARWSELSSSPGGGFDLRILPDGRARLAKKLGYFGAEQVITYSLEDDAWTRLRQEIVPLTRGKWRTVGDRAWPHFQRRLRLRFDDGALSFTESREGFEPGGSEERRCAVEDSLKAWSFVRAAIDCPECDDQTERDRALLDKR